LLAGSFADHNGVVLVHWLVLVVVISVLILVLILLIVVLAVRAASLDLEAFLLVIVVVLKQDGNALGVDSTLAVVTLEPLLFLIIVGDLLGQVDEC
jgi:hypothetical protein